VIAPKIVVPARLRNRSPGKRRELGERWTALRDGGNSRLQVTGYRLQVTGYRLQVTGYRLQVTGYRLQVTGYRLQVTGYRGQVTGYRLQVTTGSLDPMSEIHHPLP
jgi:hypothetical protein